MDIRVGDRVRHASNPHSVICDVIEVKDLGHGDGNERIEIMLPSSFLSLTRCYAAKELTRVEDAIK